MTELDGGAVLSGCRRFRYRLWRAWETGPRLLFVMLNPSTADALADDPTIRRCIGFAKRERFSGIEVVNLFGFRSTDPRSLHSQGDYDESTLDPVGEGNDRAIRAAAEVAPVIVCAWGRIPKQTLEPRAALVRRLMAFEHPEKLRCLGRTKYGDPRHPLYVRGDQPLEVYRT